MGFKAFAPEYLQYKEVSEHQLRKQMRARDYQYSYKKDPSVQYATFDREEMLLFTRLWKAMWSEWTRDLVDKLAPGDQSYITYEDFKSRSEAWVREDPRYKDAKKIPEEAYREIFDRFDTDKNNVLFFDDDKFFARQQSQLRYKQWNELYNLIELNDDGILTRDEVFKFYGGGGRGVNEEEIWAKVDAFMDTYSNDGQTVNKGQMWGKFHKIIDEEMRHVREKE